MPNPQEGPKHKPENRKRRELQQRAFSDACVQITNAVDRYIAKHPGETVNRKTAVGLQSISLQQLEDMSEGKRAYIMEQLLQLHLQITGSEYKARLDPTMHDVVPMTLAIDTLTHLFGLKGEFKERAQKEVELHREQTTTRDFYNACLSVKSKLANWQPATHPNLVPAAAPEQQLDFADSLANSAQNRIDEQGFVDLPLLQEILTLFPKIDPSNKLNLGKRYAQLYKAEASQRRAQDELNAQRRTQHEEEANLSAAEYDRFVDLMFADLIASTDLVKQHEQSDPNDTRSIDRVTQAIADAVRERVQNYPAIMDRLHKQTSDNKHDPLAFFTARVIFRFSHDFPHKKADKRGWFSWRKKESAPIQADTTGYNEQLIANAVEALYAHYKNHPEYTSTGAPGRPIQEMTNSLMGNQQALNHLRQTLRLDERASEHEVARAIQDHFYQQLKRRGLRI